MILAVKKIHEREMKHAGNEEHDPFFIDPLGVNSRITAMKWWKSVLKYSEIK